MKENFVVSFEKNHVAQANLVKAENGKQARDYFSYQNPKAHIYGVRIDMVGYARRGMPVVEVPDGWEESTLQIHLIIKKLYIRRKNWSDKENRGVSDADTPFSHQKKGKI